MTLRLPRNTLQKSLNSAAQGRCQKRKQKYIREWKEAKGCADCGETDWVVLEIHHIDGTTIATRKQKNLKQLSWANLRKELEANMVLCANDHKRREALKRIA